MSTMQMDRARVSLAAAISMTLWSAHLNAQDASKSQLEEIIVTGTLIQGTPEDSALPVEVITFEELQEQGRPSNLDLVKSLSEVGQVAGEANRYNGYPIGAATVNLRNLGARFTTVIFNGKRFPEQYSATTGRFNNISWIPNAAVGEVQILKEGGAVTYGADAVGGVVNYLTRRDVDGFEGNVDYRYIDGSDGDYNGDLLWGTRFERGNLLVIGGYQHRSRLNALERDWSQTEFLENKTAVSWAQSGSPGAYSFQRPVGVTQTQTGVTPLTVPTSSVQMGASGIVRDPACSALGGFAGWSATPSPACYMQISQFEALVEESDAYQFYAELNYDLTDSLELHTEALYYQLDAPNIVNYPSDSPDSWPLLGADRDSPTRQTANLLPAYFVDGHNPGLVDFLNNRLLNSNGTRAFDDPLIAQIVNSGRGVLTQGTWRPFGSGGNPIFGETDTQQNNTQMWRLTGDLKGDLPEFGGTELTWNVSLTYSRVDYKIEANDILVNRLQDALNGLGGANCNNIRADLAGSTCQWLNPFASAIPRNIYTGETNPGFVPALQNDPSLVRWLYVPIELDRTYNYVFADFVVSGKTGFSLPGGPIAAALGAQYRYTDEEFLIDDLSDRKVNPCPTIGVQTCTNRTGPLAYGRNGGVLGTTQEPDKRYYPVIAAFTEVQLPILNSLNLQLAGRYEKFYSDVTDKDNDIFVPAAALKWQPLDWLALRTSAGRTFSQVNPPEDDGPTVATAASNTAFGGVVGYETASYDNVNIEPEKGTYFNFGVLLDVGNFRFSADYFDIRVNDYTRTMTANNVLRALVGPGVVSANTFVKCSSPLFTPQEALGNRPFVELVGGNGNCVQDQTTISQAIGPGARINYYGGTGQTNSGQLKTTGIDLSMGYTFDGVFGGELRPSIDGTYNLAWELDDFVVGGVPVAAGYDGIGYKNGSTGRLLLAVPEWRASFNINYRWGRHNVSMSARFIPSVDNEDEGEFDASNDQNANIGVNGVTATGATGAATCPATTPITTDLGQTPAGAGSGQYATGTIPTGQPGAGTRGFCANQNASILSGRTIESVTEVDLTYRVQLPAEVAMTFTIYNLLDDEPSFDRATVGYNAGFGSPLERNYKVGFSKKF
jgi:iron complex outermembrane recepter protein